MRSPYADAADLAGAHGHHSAVQSHVQSQLAKVLESPHFRRSKRSQSLLRFVTEAALAGDQNSLKERYIGTAVFERVATYDTALDPIVRNAAIEVRKRLAQYYLEPEHVSELRIELPIGSYTPIFTTEAPALGLPKSARPDGGRSRRWIVAAAVLLLAGVGIAFLWRGRHTPGSELEAFWEPLFRGRTAIQICIGQPTRLYRFIGPRSEDLNRLLGRPAAPDREAAPVPITSGELSWVAPEYMFLRDGLAGFKVASWIQSKGRAYQLVSVSQTDYSRLRRAPLVAIGAFNNAWSMRVTSELRFVFEYRTGGATNYHSIIDRRNPNAASWDVAEPVAGAMTEDYAIVTRVFDPATEQTVISAAGIKSYGSFAASEFITQPEYVGAALQAAPKDWRRQNVQFVLGTKIIDGTSGPPRVLAAHFW